MSNRPLDVQAEQDRRSANLQKSIVMHEIRLAKEQAWRQMAEEEARRTATPEP